MNINGFRSVDKLVIYLHYICTPHSASLMHSKRTNHTVHKHQPTRPCAQAMTVTGGRYNTRSNTFFYLPQLFFLSHMTENYTGAPQLTHTYIIKMVQVIDCGLRG